MAFETKLDNGALFINDKKQQPNHPDYTGKLVLAPTTLKALQGQAGEAILYLSGWKKKSKAGVGYLSLAASLPQSSKTMSTAKPSGIPPEDDDLPF